MAGEKKTELTYRILPERMPRMDESQYDETQKKYAAIIAGSRGSLRGPFTAMIRSPELMHRVAQVGEYVRYHNSIDPRLNRFASMMVARHWSNQYEWGSAEPLAQKIGISQDLIDAIAEGRRPTDMTPDEELVHDFVTEVLVNKGVSDATYGRAVKSFGERGVLDLTAIIAYYSFNATFMNVTRTGAPGDGQHKLPPVPVNLKPLD